MAQLTDRALLSSISRDQDLSEQSRKSYLQKLKQLTEMRQRPLTILITDPESTLRFINRQYAEIQTRRGFASAVQAVFARNSTFAQKHKAAYRVWTQAARELDTLVTKRYMSNKPTPRQSRGYVDFDSVMRVRRRLAKGTLPALLLGLYTGMPPLRCDFNRVKIIARPTQPSPKAVAEPNYLWLPSQSSASPVLVLREYKTAKHYGPFIANLPASVAADIRASIQQRPRKWLFADKEGNSYSPKSFSKLANRILEDLFGRPLTLTALRHAWINHINLAKASRAQLEETARQMCHSVSTQASYRWKNHK